jgi:hypothetical protein
MTTEKYGDHFLKAGVQSKETPLDDFSHPNKKAVGTTLTFQLRSVTRHT